MKLPQSKLNRSVISAGIALTLGLAAFQSNAALNPFPVAFTTQSEASVTPIQALDFGEIMLLSAFGTCTAAASAIDVLVAYTTTPAGATGVTSTGAGCTGAGAVTNLGHYVLNGSNSADVKIKLHSASGTDFDFAPAGSFDNDLAAGVGTGGDLAADVFSTYPLSATGQGALFVGGAVTVGGTALTPGTAYTMDYDIEVTF